MIGTGYGTFGREQIYFFLTQSDQAGSALNAKSSFWAFQNWSDRLLEMKTRKVMSCGVQAGASRAGPLRRVPGAEYRSVLLVGFYHILPLPVVPLHSVWAGPVRDVVRLFTKTQKYFCKKGPRSAIKLN